MTALPRPEPTWGLAGLLGHSAALQEARYQLQEVASTDLTVLLLGETGTGKGVAARALHQWSSRPHRSFVHLDCSSLPPSLIDSELFGHEKGAFTGASLQRKGRIAPAQGGTLFLDEIGELPLDAQARLLRLLQDRLIERVGGSQPLHLDVRVIAATHRDLAQAVKDGTFRQDLYYRLHVFPVHLPALRERQEDIPLLAGHFLAEMKHQLAQPPPRLSPAGLQALQAHAWPGNVRGWSTCCSGPWSWPGEGRSCPSIWGWRCRRRPSRRPCRMHPCRSCPWPNTNAGTSPRSWSTLPA